MANRVYNNLEETPFKFELKGYEFYFSSVFHRNKYKKEIDSYCKNENLKFKNRYKIDIDLTDAFLIAFYKKVENRGFRVFYQNMNVEDTSLEVS